MLLKVNNYFLFSRCILYGLTDRWLTLRPWLWSIKKKWKHGKNRVKIHAGSIRHGRWKEYENASMGWRQNKLLYGIALLIHIAFLRGQIVKKAAYQQSFSIYSFLFSHCFIDVIISHHWPSWLVLKVCRSGDMHISLSWIILFCFY